MLICLVLCTLYAYFVLDNVFMAQHLRLTSLSAKCNEAINLKKAQLLILNKDLTKEACVYEILCEWLEMIRNNEQPMKLKPKV